MTIKQCSDTLRGIRMGSNRSPLAERTGIYENTYNLAYTLSGTRNIGISINISSGSPCGIGLRLYMNTTAKPLLYILQAERPPIFPHYVQNPRQCLGSILFFLSTYLFFKIPALNAHEKTRNWSQKVGYSEAQTELHIRKNHTEPHTGE